MSENNNNKKNRTIKDKPSYVQSIIRLIRVNKRTEGSKNISEQLNTKQTAVCGI